MSLARGAAFLRRRKLYAHESETVKIGGQPYRPEPVEPIPDPNEIRWRERDAAALLVICILGALGFVCLIAYTLVPK